MQRTPEEYVKATGKSLSWTEGSVRYTASPISASGVSVSELSAQSGPSDPVAWAVDRKDDPTFPRFFLTEDEADRMVSHVTVNPPAAKRAIAGRFAIKAALIEMLRRSQK